MADKVILTIGLDTYELNQDLGKFEQQVKQSGQKAGQDYGKGFGGGFKEMIGAVAIGNILSNVVQGAMSAIVSTMREGVNEAIQLEKAIAQVNTILRDTEQLTDSTANKFRAFGATFGTSGADQAKSYYDVVASGIEGAATQMQVLSTANKLAIGGVTDVGTAVRGLTGIFNAYKNQGVSVTKISDLLFQAAAEGSASVDSLVSSFSVVAPSASVAGIKIEELTGLIGNLTKSLGIEQTTVGLNAIISALTNQTDQAKTALKSIGVVVNEQTLKNKGLAVTLEEIFTKAGRSTAKVGEIFSEARASRVALTLMQRGFDDVSGSLEKMESASGKTESAFKRMSGTIDQKMKQSSAGWSAIFSTIGTTINSSIINGLGIFDTSPIIKYARAIAFVGELIDAAIIRPMAFLTRLIQATVGGLGVIVDVGLITPIKTVIVGLLELASLIPNEKISSSAMKIKASIEGASKSISDFNKAAVESGTNGMVENLTQQSEWSKNLKTNLKELENQYIQSQQVMSDTTAQAVKKISTDTPLLFAEGSTTISSLFSNLSSGIMASEKEVKDYNEAWKAASKDSKDNIISSLDETMQKMQRVGRAAFEIGQNFKKGFGQALGSGFAAFGAALVKGENALDAFAKAFLSTLGQMMIQQGTAFMLQGLGFSVIPGLQASGSTLIATGAALAVLGGALTAVGGGGASAGAVGGGGSAVDTTMTQDDFTKQEMKKPDTKVTVNVYGSIMDTHETGSRIVDLINTAYDKQGVVINKGAIA